MSSNNIFVYILFLFFFFLFFYIKKKLYIRVRLFPGERKDASRNSEAKIVYIQLIEDTEKNEKIISPRYIYMSRFFFSFQASMELSLYLLSTNKQCHLSKINGAIFSPNKSMTYRVQIRKNKLKCCYSVKLRVHKLTFYSSFKYFYRISYS